MYEIDKWIIDTIEADATVSGFTGKDAADKRIYSWEPNFEIVYSPTKKAALFFRDFQNSRSGEFSYPNQEGDISYYIQIIAVEKDICKQLSERIVALFKDKNIITTNWRCLNILPSGNSEGPNEGTSKRPLYNRLVILNLVGIIKR